jgi:hypothetical protein
MNGDFLETIPARAICSKSDLFIYYQAIWFLPPDSEA